MTKAIATNDEGSVKQFSPTLAMEKWLDTQVKLLTDSVKDIAQESDLSRNAWYNWQKIDGFTEWYYSEYERKLIHLRPKLDSIGLKFSEKGSYNHWKDMQKLTGRNLEPAQTHNTNVVVPVFNVMSDEAKVQLEKLYEGSNSGNS